jgi:hypothetical protein
MVNLQASTRRLTMMRQRIRGTWLIAPVLALVCAAVAVAQSATFGVGDPALNKNGSARLPVTFPAAGTAVIQDIRSVPPLLICGPSPRIKTLTTQVAAAGLTELRVAPRGTARKKIADGHSVKVVAQISFTPTGGTTGTQIKTMKLHRQGNAATVQSLAVAACALPPH